MAGLHWHILHHATGLCGWYGTDGSGSCQYVVTGDDYEGWLVSEVCHYSHDIMGRRLIEVIESGDGWCFDTHEQARGHAEILYREKNAREARTNIKAINQNK